MERVAIGTHGVPREFRIESEGAIYHLLSRDDRRKGIF